MQPIRLMDLRSTYRWGGGPDKTILNSAKMHDKSIVDTLVVYLRSDWDTEFTLAKKAADMGVRCVEIIETKALDGAAFKKVVECARKNRIQIIHSRDYKTNIMALLIKTFYLPDIKIITMAHGWVGTGHKLRFYYFIDRIVASFFDRNLLLFSGQRAQFIRRPALHKTIVVHNGIDTIEWNSTLYSKGKLRNEFSIPSDIPIIGYTGRIMPEKDILTMVKVAQKLVFDKGQKVKFVLIGESKTGVYSDAVKRAITAAHLDDTFVFTGVRHDLKELLVDFDIFLMTSLQEGFPNSLLEGMAMKIPAVVSAVDGIPEIMANDENALLCPAGSIDCFVRALDTLLNNPHQCTALADNAFALVNSKLSFTYRLKKMERIYMDLMDNKITMALGSPTNLSEDAILSLRG